MKAFFKSLRSNNTNSLASTKTKSDDDILNSDQIIESSHQEYKDLHNKDSDNKDSDNKDFVSDGSDNEITSGKKAPTDAFNNGVFEDKNADIDKSPDFNQNQFDAENSHNLRDDFDSQYDLAKDLQQVSKIFAENEDVLIKEYSAYKAQKLFGKINLMLTIIKLSDQKLKSHILDAINLGLKSVTVFSSKLAIAKKYAANKIQVRAAYMFPFGAEIFSQKIKGLKAIVKLKPDAIEIPFDLTDADKKPSQAIREWKKLRKKAGKIPLIAVVDFNLYNTKELEECAKIVKDAKLWGIKTSSLVLSDGGFDFQLLSAAKTLTKINIEAAYKTPTPDDILYSFKWGAATFSGQEVIKSLLKIKNLLIQKPQKGA